MEDIIKLRSGCKAVNCLKKMPIENEFVRALAHIEHCGIKFDPIKWKAKMTEDAESLRTAKQKLNDWAVDYVMKKDDPDI